VKKSGLPRTAISAATWIPPVFASYNSWESLEQCLSSLAGQQATEVIVADCSDADRTPVLAARFPNVKFCHYNRRMSIPRLR